MAIRLTYLNIFVTNIVLYQLHMISKRFIQETMNILTFPQVKWWTEMIDAEISLHNRPWPFLTNAVVVQAKMCLCALLFEYFKSVAIGTGYWIPFSNRFQYKRSFRMVLWISAQSTIEYTLYFTGSTQHSVFKVLCYRKWIKKCSNKMRYKFVIINLFKYLWVCKTWW